MAQSTKTRSNSASAPSKRKTAGSSSTRKSTTKSRSGKSTAAKRKPSSKGPKEKVEAVKDAAVDGAGSAGDAVASAAKKLKTPALAVGAGIAGLAGGIALSRNRKESSFKLPLPTKSAARATSKNLANAAKSVGVMAERTGRVAEQVRVASEAVADNGSRSSPIETILQGLTRRRM